MWSCQGQCTQIFSPNAISLVNRPGNVFSPLNHVHRQIEQGIILAQTIWLSNCPPFKGRAPWGSWLPHRQGHLLTPCFSLFSLQCECDGVAAALRVIVHRLPQNIMKAQGGPKSQIYKTGGTTTFFSPKTFNLLSTDTNTLLIFRCKYKVSHYKQTHYNYKIYD